MLSSFPIKNILCWGRDGPPLRSCRKLLYDMKADLKPRVFGLPNDPATQVATPYVIESRKLAFERRSRTAPLLPMMRAHPVFETL